MLNRLLSILQKSNLFLTGGGGVGKSYMTREIIKAYRELGCEVVVLGSTGISAVGIGGMTLHSFFRLGICKNHEELKAFDKKQKSALKELKQILKKCKLIVIDEISMVAGDLFELIYYRLLNSEFSGKVMAVGDFYQLPPIVKKTYTKQDLFYSYYAFSSDAWKRMNFTYVEILGSKRVSDPEFYKILSNLRTGRLDGRTFEYINLLKTDENQINKESCVLFGRNFEADSLNNKKLHLLNTPLESSQGYVKIHDYAVKEDKINKWINNLNIVEDLYLKVGAKVVFTINKWAEFFNGEQGIVREILKQNGQITSVFVEKSNGRVVEVVRNSYEMNEFMMLNGELKDTVLATYYQFPLKLAYALTVHKSQGMSIENLVCDLNHIFANGQLYVALSRAMNPKNLQVIYNKNLDFKNYIKSVVKIDNEVRNFYENETFIYIQN